MSIYCRAISHTQRWCDEVIRYSLFTIVLNGLSRLFQFNWEQQMKNNSANFIQIAEWCWLCFSVRLWFGVQIGHMDPENRYFKLTLSISSWKFCRREFPDAEASRLLPSRLMTFHSTVNISRTYITTNNQAHVQHQQYIHHHQITTGNMNNINSTYITTNKQPGTWTVHSSPPTNHHVQHQ